GRVREPREGSQVPTRAVLCAPPGTEDLLGDSSGPAHPTAPPRARDRQLGRRSRRGLPAPRPHIEHERPEPPSPGHLAAHAIPAALRGPRPPSDPVGP